jgi:hypothetical protein
MLADDVKQRLTFMGEVKNKLSLANMIDAVCDARAVTVESVKEVRAAVYRIIFVALDNVLELVRTADSRVTREVCADLCIPPEVRRKL